MDIILSLNDCLDEIAEVAACLWDKGWAERNAGNLTMNVTGAAGLDDIAGNQAQPHVHSIGWALPALSGQYFYCKSAGRRLRDVARQPLQNGCIIHIMPSGEGYEIVWGHPMTPTSELPSHLMAYQSLAEASIPCRAMLHTHPTELVALSHSSRLLGDGSLSRLLWGMIPEVKMFCPQGVRVLPYMRPGSHELACATAEAIASHDVVLWARHGAVAAGESLGDAFDKIDVLNKAAQIYQCARAFGFEPEGLSDTQISELTNI